MGDQLDEPIGSSGSSVYIVFTLFTWQIKYDDDDDAEVKQLALLSQRGCAMLRVCRQLASLLQ